MANPTPRASGAAGTYMTSRGVELCYELNGDGVPIAFVNSFFMPSAGWRLFTEDLVRTNRILTYDLGAQGWSHEDVADFGSYVADLDELLDALELESTYLLGHSSGTQIAAAYAAECPQRVRGLVLVGPLVNPTGGERRRAMVAAWRDAYVSGGWPRLFDLLWWLVHSEATLERAGPMGRRLMRRRFEELNRESDPMPLFALSDTHQVEFAPDWSAIAMPTLLLSGADDCVTTTSGLAETRELIASSEVVLVPRAGHVLYLEAPQAFQSEVRRFVERVEAGRG